MKFTKEQAGEIISRVMNRVRELGNPKSVSRELAWEEEAMAHEAPVAEFKSEVMRAIATGERGPHKKQPRPNIPKTKSSGLSDTALVKMAWKLREEAGPAFSVSLIQRRFEIGYPRASRINDKLFALDARKRKPAWATGEAPVIPMKLAKPSSHLDNYRDICWQGNIVPSDAIMSLAFGVLPSEMDTYRNTLCAEGFAFIESQYGWSVTRRPAFKSKSEALAAIKSMDADSFWTLAHYAREKGIL